MPSVLELRWPRKLSDRAVEAFRVARGLDILDPERLARFDGRSPTMQRSGAYGSLNTFPETADSVDEWLDAIKLVIAHSRK